MTNYYTSLPKEQVINIEDIPISLHLLEDGEWLLTDKQVARAYDISTVTIRRHLQRNNNVLIEGQHWFMKKGNLPPRFPHLRLWTRDGFIALGNYIKTAKANILLTSLGVKTRQMTKIESEYFDVINSTFESIMPVRFQYPAGKYKVDIYFPILRLAIEIDEFDHATYNQEDESVREEFVRGALGCEIIRFNPNLLSNNVGKLINAILRYAKKMGQFTNDY